MSRWYIFVVAIAISLAPGVLITSGCGDSKPAGSSAPSFDPVDGLVLDEDPGEDVLSGQWGNVRFKAVSYQDGESARVRFVTSGHAEELYVHVSGRKTAELLWNGQTIDGFGPLSSEQEDALRELAGGPMGEALAMIPLDLGCAEQQYEPASMQALLFAWQLVLKYLEEQPAEIARDRAAASRCAYFPPLVADEEDEADDTETQPAGSQILLSREDSFPSVFFFAPLDAEGARQGATDEQDLSTRGSEMTVCDFGPNNSGCRGSCGADCTSNNCRQTKSLEHICGEAVVVSKFTCGVHSACIAHDHCYDQCERDAPTPLAASICRRLACDPPVAIEHGPCTAQDWSNGYGPHSYKVDFYYHSRCGATPCIDEELERKFGPPGGSRGDPHLTTIDGMAYDFQAAGEFVLVEALHGDPFAIQVRQEQVSSQVCPARVTSNTAAAMAVAGRRVAFYAGREHPLLIDGSPAQLGSGTLPLGQGAILSQQGSRYMIHWPAGELVAVDVRSRHLDIGVDLPESRKNDYGGLLGTYNDDTSDDITLRDGTVLAQPVQWDAIYQSFGESWRVGQEASLFDYTYGESTDTFTDRSVPLRPATLEALPDEQRQMAEQTCQDAGISDDIVMSHCVIDVACTADASFAETYAEQTPPTESLEVIEPIFMDGWAQQGNPSAGTWEITDDGRSVRQTTNGDPTFFVSARDYIGVRIRGTFEVDTGGDDDYVGFVFGYGGPLESNGDAVDDYDTFILSWKQDTQSSAEEGFTLAHANGVIDSIDATFWRQEDTASYQVLATNYGAERGWVDYTLHEFELVYGADQIRVWIDGELIFDITPAQAGISFEPGRFGFYNYSQAQVIYSDFSVEELGAD